MKNKIGLKQKILMFICLMTDGTYANGLIEVCPRCGSYNFTKEDTTESDTESGYVYNATYICKKCGAKATVKEEWKY